MPRPILGGKSEEEIRAAMDDKPKRAQGIARCRKAKRIT
jgi:hypothetical protein